MKINKKIHVRRKGPGKGRMRRNPRRKIRQHNLLTKQQAKKFTNKLQKGLIERDIMLEINKGNTPNANAIAKKYHIPFKALDKILEDNELDVCNKCYNIHKINWGSLTRAPSGLTYCESCRKSLPKICHIIVMSSTPGFSETFDKDNEKTQKLFEEIQNKYSLYDNCVFEEAHTNTPARVVIEGHDESQARAFYEELKNKYGSDKVRFEIVTPEDTIIDKDRTSETGPLTINKKLIPSWKYRR